ncbi:hypothetical protein GF377_03760 [candidate division GN15 bacterium]|nr:hypothetical protein [candidate division GN15 bacterium]
MKRLRRSIQPPRHRAKKKQPGSITVVDELAGGEAQTGDDLADDITFKTPPPASDLETYTLQMVKSDPFVTIGEIRQSFERQPFGEKVGWWRVFRILRRHRLVRRKSRFRYAWGRS